jgi:hypothetical protein
MTGAVAPLRCCPEYDGSENEPERTSIQGRQMMASLHPKMAANLHFAVCETYRQAIAERRAECEGFDMAARVVCERHPGVRPVEARRRVAEMPCGDPPVSGMKGSSLRSMDMEFQR